MFAHSPSLADRFTWLFDGLCKVIGTDAHACRMEASLAWAVWNRVRVLGARLIALIARARAGRLAARAKGTPHPGPPPQGGREKSAGAGAGAHDRLLPRGFGWMRRVLPRTAQFAGVLSYLLRDPEVVAMLEKTPQAGRILRPLCYLLGVPAPEFLRRRETGEVACDVPSSPIQRSAIRDEGDEQGRASPAEPRPEVKLSVDGEEGDSVPASAPPPPPRPLSSLEQEAVAMREWAARWVARQPDRPSTLLPLGLSPVLDMPGTVGSGPGAKNRG
jgi:hypothetical protein